MRWSLRVLAGFAAGFGAWLWLAPGLHRFLVAVVTALLADSGIAFLFEGSALRVGPSEVPRARADVPLAILTSNLVLFVALWSWDRGSFGLRSLGRLLAGLAILIAIQACALLAAIHATLAVNLADASGMRYTTWEANFWFLAWQGYQVVGAWAVAFMVWWGIEAGRDGVRERGDFAVRDDETKAQTNDLVRVGADSTARQSVAGAPVTPTPETVAVTSLVVLGYELRSAPAAT